MIEFVPGSSTCIVAGGNGEGSELDQLSFPQGLFVDDAGHVYVADARNARVMRWAPGASSGVLVAGGNGAGDALNQVGIPQDVAVDAGGSVYVADALNHRVVRWDTGASEGVVVAGGNGLGGNLNQVAGPLGLFVDAARNVYVSDGGDPQAPNPRIVRWAPGASEGVVVAGGNGQGDRLDQLDSPASVFVDDSSNVYVTDNRNQRVVRWDRGASEGVIVSPQDLGAETSLRDVFVDRAANVYVSDSGANSRVLRWALGDPERVATIFTGPGSDLDQVSSPSGIVVDRAGNLYVSDTWNNRVIAAGPICGQ